MAQDRSKGISKAKGGGIGAQYGRVRASGQPRRKPRKRWHCPHRPIADEGMNRNRA